MTSLRTCPGCKEAKEQDAFRARFKECKKCVVERTRLWRLDNPVMVWTSYRKNYLKKYDLTLFDFSTLVSLCADSCIVCGGREVAFKELHVDHDHHGDAGVRGLLCDRCNQLLGKVKDDPVTLDAIAEYLERPLPELADIQRTRPASPPPKVRRKTIHGPAGHRECRKCRNMLPLEQYYVTKNGKHTYSCKKCTAQWGNGWRIANPEAFVLAKKRTALKKFNITLEQSEALLQSQGGVCAACGKPDAQGIALAHDHAHTEGEVRVRGLLCTLCNWAEGTGKGSPAIFRKLAAYIRISVGRPEKWWRWPQHRDTYRLLRSTPSDAARPL